MLISLFEIWNNGNFSMLQIVFLLLSYAVIVFVSLPIHELAHAFVAAKLGDNTARWHGRLSLNPLKHLDPLGTVMILVCGFGYAKPVPINPYNFRNPKKGMALSALAGPLSNLLMAILSVAVFRLVCAFCGAEFVNGSIYVDYETLETLNIAHLILIQVFAGINVGLAVFNLLPIPPLDGSHIFGAFLPDRFLYTMERYQPYISTVLMVLLLATDIFDTPLYWLRHGFGFVICGLFGMPNVF